MTSRGKPNLKNETARASMCRGKVRFNSAHKAYKRLKAGARRRRDKWGLTLTPYHCVFCGGWHWGSTS